MLYLDYAAHTPASEAVLRRFCEIERDYPANPNSLHPMGKAALEKLNEITLSLAQKLGVEPQEIIFTSGASEANNLAIKGLTEAYRENGRHILSTPLEHSSVSGALTALQEKGYEIDLLRITPQGQVDLEQLRERLRPDTVLVSVCWTDSELGSIQPIREMRAILEEYPNCRFHTDATQAVGKIPVDFSLADCAVFAPHKFFGLNGSGILIKKKGVVLTPLIHGGTGGAVSTGLYRGGTPALAHAAALELALSDALSQQAERLAHAEKLNGFLRKRLETHRGVRINSPQAAVPFILNISVKGIRGTQFRDALAEEGVCVSVKSACSVENTPSRAVYAVSRDRKNALSSFRISLSHLTTHEDVEAFGAAFERCLHRLSPT